MATVLPHMKKRRVAPESPAAPPLSAGSSPRLAAAPMGAAAQPQLSDSISAYLSPSHMATSSASPARAPNEWLRAGAFRTGRDEWNEAAFVHLDRTLAEAARQNLRVQLCLANWWRDTGGIAQYLAWAGRADAADPSQPFGINRAAATAFYTDPEARRLYREHVTQADTGVDLDFLVGRSGSDIPRRAF